MTVAGLTDVGATIRGFWRVRVFKMFKIIEFLGEIEDAWALPMGGRKSSMLLTLLGNQDFAICLGQFCINFLLAHWTDTLRFFHTSASIIKDSSSRIIDIVIKRSYFLTFSAVGAEVMRRIDE